MNFLFYLSVDVKMKNLSFWCWCLMFLIQHQKLRLMLLNIWQKNEHFCFEDELLFYCSESTSFWFSAETNIDINHQFGLFYFPFLFSDVATSCNVLLMYLIILWSLYIMLMLRSHFLHYDDVKFATKTITACLH